MISVKVDQRSLQRAFKSLGKDVPKAMAETLTILALSSRKKLIATLPEHMHIRSKWSEKGMQAIPARPSKLTAEVGSTRAYMVDQVYGGTRTGSEAIPQVGADGQPRKSIQDLTRPSKWPGKLIAKDATKPAAKRRIVVMPTKSGARGVWKKTGRMKRGRVPSSPLKLLYVLSKQVRIRPSWPLAAIVQTHAQAKLSSAVERGFNTTMERALRRAGAK